MPDSSVVPAEKGTSRWLVGAASLGFILLQSACTAIMAVSGLRLLVGLGALAAASGVSGVAGGFHRDAVRIPMMVAATAGSLFNLYILWRVRSLRSRPSSQWRRERVSQSRITSERVQIACAVATLVLVAAELVSHHFVFRG